MRSGGGVGFLSLKSLFKSCHLKCIVTFYDWTLFSSPFLIIFQWQFSRLSVVGPCSFFFFLINLLCFEYLCKDKSWITFVQRKMKIRTTLYFVIYKCFFASTFFLFFFTFFTRYRALCPNLYKGCLRGHISASYSWKKLHLKLVLKNYSDISTNT